MYYLYIVNYTYGVIKMSPLKSCFKKLPYRLILLLTKIESNLLKGLSVKVTTI